MRHRALERMRRLEAERGLESIAFEMLGPPRLSKLLYEAFLLKRVAGSLAAIAASDPGETSARAARLVEEDADLRAAILSIGIPIWLPDGGILRGPEMKTPPYKEEARAELDAETMVRWADAGWVDLRPENMRRWRDRAREIVGRLKEHPTGDTSSTLFEDEEYWRVETDVPVGRVAAWILGVEERGQRGKAS
jgi:hypothetical protein